MSNSCFEMPISLAAVKGNELTFNDKFVLGKILDYYNYCQKHNKKIRIAMNFIQIGTNIPYRSVRDSIDKLIRLDYVYKTDIDFLPTEKSIGLFMPDLNGENKKFVIIHILKDHSPQTSYIFSCFRKAFRKENLYLSYNRLMELSGLGRNCIREIVKKLIENNILNFLQKENSRLIKLRAMYFDMYLLKEQLYIMPNSKKFTVKIKRIQEDPNPDKKIQTPTRRSKPPVCVSKPREEDPKRYNETYKENLNENSKEKIKEREKNPNGFFSSDFNTLYECAVKEVLGESESEKSIVETMSTDLLKIPAKPFKYKMKSGLDIENSECA